MLSAPNRLRRMRDVRAVVRRGISLSTQLFTLRANQKASPPPRFSFIVSNKVSKHAVVRNTIKRRLREIIRKRTDAFRQDADYAFIAKAPSATASFDALKGDVESILARLPRPSGAPAYRRSNSPVSKKPLS
ncbi:MAG: ribonuclease P protein component [Patescibacteria group bacterium]